MIIDHFYDDKRKIHWYHLGYYSDQMYLDFYQWQRTVKLHYEYSDMPHDYFVFLDESDRREMHKRFKGHISKRERKKIWLEEFHDMTAPVDTTSMNHLLVMDFQAAIQEEINREILESIMGKANTQ